MVSHSDDFGVGAPQDSANPDADALAGDDIFAQMQRRFLGTEIEYLAVATAPTPIVTPEAEVIVEPEPHVVEPVTTMNIPPVVSQLLEMEQRDRGADGAVAKPEPLFAPVFADDVAVPEIEAALDAEVETESVVESRAEVRVPVPTVPVEAAPVLSRRALREQGLLTAMPRVDEETPETVEVVVEAEAELAPEPEPEPELEAEGAAPEDEAEVVAPVLELEKVVKQPKQPKPAKVKVAKPKVAKVKKPALVSARARKTSGVVTMVAMAFIAGLAVATSVPANALLTQDQIHAINTGLSEDGYAIGQEVEAANAVVASGRDKVSATQWGGVLGGGLYSNVTYVNDPLGTIQWPFRRTVPISDLFGTRANPFGSGTTFHHGMDFNPGEGAPIQIIADGVVSAVVQDEYGGLGYYVIVDHNVKGMKFQSVYGHMKAGSIQVRVGQRVSVTDIVGQVGSTGASTGAHLHFEIRVDGAVIDPLTWLQKYTN